MDSNRIHPEGAPGKVEELYRRALGDQGYEDAVRRQNGLTDIHILQQDAIRRRLEADADLVAAKADVCRIVGWAIVALVCLAFTVAIWAVTA